MSIYKCFDCASKRPTGLTDDQKLPWCPRSGYGGGTALPPPSSAAPSHITDDNSTIKPPAKCPVEYACCCLYRLVFYHELRSERDSRHLLQTSCGNAQRTPRPDARPRPLRKYSTIVILENYIQMSTHPSVLSQLHEDEILIGSCRSQSKKKGKQRRVREKGALPLVKCQRLTLVLWVCCHIERQRAHGLQWRKKAEMVNAGSLLLHYSWASLPLDSVSSLSPPLHTTWRELGVFLSWETQLAEQKLKRAAVVGEYHFIPAKEGATFFFFFSPMRREKSKLFIMPFKSHGEHSLENTTWPVTLRHPTPLHIFVIYPAVTVIAIFHLLLSA